MGKPLTKWPHFEQIIVYCLSYVKYFYKRSYLMTIKSVSQWFMIISKSGWIIQFELFYFSPTLKDSNLFGHMTPLWCHWIDGYMTLPLWLPGYRVIVWRWNNWNVQSNKVNYWWKPQGRKQYESMNSPWKYTFKESRDKNKTTLVRYSVQQEPWKIRQGRNPESEGRRTPEEIAKARILSPKDGEPSKKIESEGCMIKLFKTISSGVGRRVSALAISSVVLVEQNTLLGVFN